MDINLEIVAIIISFVALIFSMMQFFSEKNRSRKEATIHAFDNLEDDECVQKLFTISEREINDLVDRKQKCNLSIEDEWRDLSKALSLIEHFAVGINNKMYDVKVLNSMAGNKMISVFNNCEKLLKHKREGVGNENNYLEFENMINSLKSVRSKNGQVIPGK